MPKPNVKDRIVAAGLEVLHRQGFNGSGVQDITDAAGVPKGSFYNHFESKEVLGIGALDRYWQGALTKMPILRDASIPPIERLRRYFQSLFAISTEQGYSKGCLIGNFSLELADHSPAVRDRLAEILKAWTGAIEDCLREAKQSGALRNDLDPSAVSAFMLNAWEGTVLRAKVDKDGSAYAQFDAAIFDGMLR